MVPTKSGEKKMLREVSVQKASVFNVIQICTSIFLGFFLTRRGSSRAPHKRNQNGKMLAPNVMARFLVSLLASPNQRFLWSLCMRSIYSTPSTDRYKTHYTYLVLLIRNHDKIISRHFFVIHISLSFSDSNITISTIETENTCLFAAWRIKSCSLCDTKGYSVNSMLFGVQYFEFIITNVKIADLDKYAIINNSSIFRFIFWNFRKYCPNLNSNFIDQFIMQFKPATETIIFLN